jgi:HD-GYP domain-containing protein (c-di-GMP phosphodiesterase class II)
MKKTLLKKNSELTADADVYDNKGNMLVKTGAHVSGQTAMRLKDAGIPFIYAEDPDIRVSRIYKSATMAEFLRVLWYFKATNGEKAEILKRYSRDEVNEFLSYSKESSAKLAYGHIFGYFAARMAKEVKNSEKKYYDFQDYRGEAAYGNFHAINVSCISGAIGANMGLEEGEVRDLISGSALADIKMGLYGFVNESRPLDPVETGSMRQHTLAGFDSIRGIYGITSRTAAVVLQHHERHDGSGYPGGLKGGGIQLTARIAAVADVYDSMTSRRPFRAPFLPEEAWEHIAENSGILFDPDVVSEFKRTVPKFMPGDTVLLSDGKIGVVRSNSYGKPDNPEIIIIEKTPQSAIISSGEKGKNSVVKTTLSIR